MDPDRRDNSVPPLEGPVPDHLVDAFFDHALDEGSRERLFRAMLRDPVRAEQVARTQRAIQMLRRPVEAPDVTARVLARVGARRGFLSRRTRGLVTAGRLVGVAAVLIVVLGAALTQRYAPDAVRFTPQVRPVSDLVRAGQNDAGAGAQQMADTLTAVARRAEPLVGLGREMLRTSHEHRVATALSPGTLTVRTLPERPGEWRIEGGSGGSQGAAVRSFAVHAELAWAFPGAICPQRPGRAVGGYVGPQVEQLLILPAEPDDPGVARWVEVVGIRRASASAVPPTR